MGYGEDGKVGGLSANLDNSSNVIARGSAQESPPEKAGIALDKRKHLQYSLYYYEEESYDATGGQYKTREKS